MDQFTVNDYCLSKRGAYADYPFGSGVLVIKTASKMFALLSQMKGQSAISLKCDPYIAENLRQQYNAVIPGYHLNKAHWNTVILDGSIPDGEICRMIDHSYELVCSKLTKKERDDISEKKSKR